MDSDRQDGEVLSFTVEATNRGLWLSFLGTEGTRTRMHLSVAQAHTLARTIEETMAAVESALRTILSAHDSH